jgi:hypothetical protein
MSTDKSVVGACYFSGSFAESKEFNREERKGSKRMCGKARILMNGVVIGIRRTV